MKRKQPCYTSSLVSSMSYLVQDMHDANPTEGSGICWRELRNLAGRNPGGSIPALWVADMLDTYGIPCDAPEMQELLAATHRA
jgi:hypothetical protein